jgi:hypothetical protein
MTVFDNESFLENVRNRQYYYFGNVIDTGDFNLFKYIRLLDSHPPKDTHWQEEKETVWLNKLAGRESSPIFIKKIMNDLKKTFTLNNINCHTYSGFTETSESFGIHKDKMDVLYLQSIGSVIWSVWESDINKSEILPEQGKCVFKETFTPGDLIWIPRGTYHHVKPLGPRVGFSFGVENNLDPSTYI